MRWRPDTAAPADAAPDPAGRSTALDRYVRLEALGLWREDRDARPREVIVAFGRTTLVLRGLDEHALGHWALAGVRIAGRANGAMIYSMTEDGAETLAIRDRDMVEAIAAVSRAVARPSAPIRRPRRLRIVFGLLVLGVLAAALAYGPDLIGAQAARMVPPARAEEFGDRMLIALIEARGAPCAGAAGGQALAQLGATVARGSPPRLRVLDLGAAPVAALPGGTVVIDRGMLARARSPAEVAGWIAVALGRDPLDELVAAAGLLGSLRYILTGVLGEPALARAVANALGPPAKVAATPGSVPAPPLSDREWAALRAICR